MGPLDTLTKRRGGERVWRACAHTVAAQDDRTLPWGVLAKGCGVVKFRVHWTETWCCSVPAFRTACGLFGGPERQCPQCTTAAPPPESTLGCVACTSPTPVHVPFSPTPRYGSHKALA